MASCVCHQSNNGRACGRLELPMLCLLPPCGPMRVCVFFFFFQNKIDRIIFLFLLLLLLLLLLLQCFFIVCAQRPGFRPHCFALSMYTSSALCWWFAAMAFIKILIKKKKQQLQGCRCSSRPSFSPIFCLTEGFPRGSNKPSPWWRVGKWHCYSHPLVDCHRQHCFLSYFRFTLFARAAPCRCSFFFASFYLCSCRLHLLYRLELHPNTASIRHRAPCCLVAL